MKRLNISLDLNPQIEQAALKVAPLYRLFGWSWSDTGVPTAEDIQKTIVELAEPVIEGKCESMATGRLKVERDYDGETTSLRVSLDLADIYEVAAP